MEIELRDLKAVLDGVVIGDWAQFHVEERTDDLFGRYAVVVDTFASDRVLQKIDEFNQKARLNATAKKPFKPIEISDTGLELIEPPEPGLHRRPGRVALRQRDQDRQERLCHTKRRENQGLLGRYDPQ